MPWPRLRILLWNMCRTWLVRGRTSQSVLYFSIHLNYICSNKCFLESLAQLQALHLKQTPSLPTGWESALGSSANDVKRCSLCSGVTRKVWSFHRGMEGGLTCSQENNIASVTKMACARAARGHEGTGGCKGGSVKWGCSWKMGFVVWGPGCFLLGWEVTLPVWVDYSTWKGSDTGELERLFSLASEGTTRSNNMKLGKPSLAVRRQPTSHLPTLL